MSEIKIIASFCAAWCFTFGVIGFLGNPAIWYGPIVIWSGAFVVLMAGLLIAKYWE